MRPTSESVGRYRFMAMPRRRLRRRKGEGSPIEAGKLELNPQTVQLKPLINDVISTAGQLAEQNKNQERQASQETPAARRRPRAERSTSAFCSIWRRIGSSMGARCSSGCGASRRLRI